MAVPPITSSGPSQPEILSSSNKAAAITVAALAALTLVGSFFFLLASQGVYFGSSFNAFVNSIHPIYIYVTLGLSLGVLVLACAIMRYTHHREPETNSETGKTVTGSKKEPSAPIKPQKEAPIKEMDPAVVATLLTKKQIKNLGTQYADLYRIRDFNSGEKTIYALCKGKNEPHYFETSEERDRYIAQHLNHSIEVGRLDSAVYDENSGIIATENLETLCSDVDDYYLSNISIDGKIAYILIFRDEDGEFLYLYFKNKEDREKATQIGEGFGPDEGFCNASFKEMKAQMLFQDHLLDKFLLAPGDYFKITSTIYAHRHDYLFVFYVNAEGRMCRKIFFEYKADDVVDFLEENHLTSDKESIIYGGSEFPPEFEVFCDKSKVDVAKLDEDEFMTIDFKTENSRFPTIYGLAFHSTQVEWRFFRSSQAREKFYDQKRWGNAEEREKRCTENMVLLGRTIQDHSREKKPLFIEMELTDSFWLITYQEGTVSHFYCPKDKKEAFVQEKLASLRFVSQDELKKIPLSKAEKDKINLEIIFLEQTLEKKLLPKHYRLTDYNFSSVLFFKGDGKNNKLQKELYRRLDPRVEERIKELKALNYQELK